MALTHEPKAGPAAPPPPEPEPLPPEPPPAKPAGAAPLEARPVEAAAPPEPPPVEAVTGPSAQQSASVPRPSAQASPAFSPLTGSGTARLLVGDIRVALVLANTARYQALGWLGVKPEDVNIASLVILGMIGESVPRSIKRFLTLPGRPDRIDGLFGFGLADELVHDFAGPASRKVPYFGALVALGLAAGLARPAVRDAMRDAHAASLGAGRHFHHRYGYLVAARAKRAQRAVDAD